MPTMVAMPNVDKRAPADIVAQLQQNAALSQGPGAALARIFAHYCEIAIDRINRAPDKNFLAYLDLLGNTLLPPTPALAPLTFSLAAGAMKEAVVPAGTQVAAQLLPGEQKPIVFETESELIVVPVQLVKAVARDSRTDLDHDVSVLADPNSTAAQSAFKGIQVMVHDLYIALPDSLFLPPLTSTVKLTFTIGQADFTGIRELAWESWDGSKWSEVSVPYDGTSKLTTSGQINLNQVVPGPALAVNGLVARWIRCRWKTPISWGMAKPGMIPENNLPTIQDIQAGSTIDFDNSSIQAAFCNDKPVDLSKDFLPLGEHPKIGDTFYLMSPAFGRNQSCPVLTFSTSEGYTIYTAGRPQVHWEFWNGASWIPLRGDLVSPGINGDLTASFTYASGGAVDAFVVGDPQPRSINGITGYWARARLSAGDYGQDVHVSSDNVVSASKLSPPSYKSMSVAGSLNVPNQAPGPVVTCNDWKYEAPSLPFVPFKATTETTLSLGFSTPAGQPFPNRSVSLYISAAPLAYGAQPPDNPAPISLAHLTWQYWNGAWNSLSVSDGTRALTRDGMLRFLTPLDFVSHSDAGADLYWIRAVWERGDYELEPRLRKILPNTVTAAQTATLRNEILGSSSGSRNQVFSAARSPVLAGQQLQVREPALPAAEDQAAILGTEGSDAILNDATGIWVRWHAVPDFYGSGPNDRHYVIDPLTGQVTFGDGQNGRIPFAGSNNIRLALYRTGGGINGNRPIANVTQMKTTVPYVDRVTNYQPASGGAEAEDPSSLQVRGPRTVRHGGRAVTAEDYEDLARLASPGVARAKCAPTRDLKATGMNTLPGKVSLIVVPLTSAARPAPDVTLIEDVQNYVDLHRIPTADLTVVGPPFVRVDVAVSVVLTSLDVSNEVEAGIQAALASYLHPLTGGRDGNGWDFGRQPHKSELYTLIGSIAGVRYVKSLLIGQTGEPASAPSSGYFVVYSGTHKVAMEFD